MIGLKIIAKKYPLLQLPMELTHKLILLIHDSSVRLMTNNPRKIKGLEDVDIKVTERVSIEIEPNKHNEDYLKVKADKLGHMIGPLD